MLLHRRKSFRGGASNGLATDLYGYRKLDGDATDSHSTNDGSATNVTWTTGLLNDGMETDRTTDGYIDLGFSLENGSFNTGMSISFWFHKDGTTNNEYVITSNDAFLFGFRADLTNRVLVYMDGSARINNTGTITWSTGTWYHVAITYDYTTIKLYIDGVYEFSAAYTGDIGPGNLRFSRNGSGLDGMVDEVALYSDRVLSDGGVSTGQTATEDIALLYNSGSPLPYADYS